VFDSIIPVESSRTCEFSHDGNARGLVTATKMVPEKIYNFLLQNGILKTSYEFQTFIGQRCLILRVMLQFKLPLYNYSVIFN
jgi:hypothetical protein